MRATFKNPPIVEGIFEGFFPPSKLWTEQVHEQLVKDLATDYSGKRENLQLGSLQIDIASAAAKAIHSTPVPRTRLWRTDGTRMIQFGPEMCALNILPKYTQFEDYLPDFEKLLGKYLGILKPNSVGFLGQRYINRIVLPSAKANPWDYFAVYPKLPDALVDKNASFALQVQMSPLETASIVVNLQLQGLESENRPVYLLEIYARSSRPIDPTATAMVKWNEQIHDHLFEAFAYCLRDEARKLFN